MQSTRSDKYLFLCISLLLCSISFASDSTIEPLPQSLKTDLSTRGLWNKSCPVPLERFALLRLSYYDFEGHSHEDGQMIVFDAAAKRVLKIFNFLYDKKFPISKIRLTSEYDGDDKKSVTDNNTSAFTCRAITNGTTPSLHSYGLAIDLNPVQNPFIAPLHPEDGIAEVIPPSGLGYLNRTNQRSGMAELVTEIFQTNGFPTWGGKWNDPIDWQHFQVPRVLTVILTQMPLKHAETFFDLFIENPKMLSKVSLTDEAPELMKLYAENPAFFLKVFKQFGKPMNELSAKDAISFMKEKFKSAK